MPAQRLPVYVEAEKRFRDRLERMPLGSMVLGYVQQSNIDAWTEPLPEPEEADRRALLRGLEDAVVVDALCGGPESVEPFRELLARYGARAYVGIDNRTFDADTTGVPIRNFGIAFRLRPRPGAVPGVVVQGDAVEVMRRLPSGLGAVALNGINNEIMNPTEPYGRDFLDNVVRVAGPRGLIFGVERSFGPLAELVRTDNADGDIIQPSEPNAPVFYFLYPKPKPRRRQASS